MGKEDEEFQDLSGNGGVLKQIIIHGYGIPPKKGSSIEVHYIGTLESGLKFDSSREKGRTFKFILGKKVVIQGWEIGIATMLTGEKSILKCRADYAYGDSSTQGDIPPNSTLIFEIDLISHVSPVTPHTPLMLPLTGDHHPTNRTAIVTNYFPMFFKDFAASYGDAYFTCMVRNYTILKNATGLCSCQPQKFAYYNIDIIRGARSWTIRRRYSEFYDFFLKTKFPYESFPKKTVFVSFAKDLLQDRTTKLNSFLHSYLEKESKEGRLRTNLLVVDFLELQK